MDDVEDNSELRRGIPVAHHVYGVPQTINTANYVYFLAVQELTGLARHAAAKGRDKGKGKEKEEERDLVAVVNGQYSQLDSWSFAVKGWRIDRNPVGERRQGSL